MKKLFEAKKEMPIIKKDATNPFFKSGYASLSNIIEVVEPILHKHGLFISHSMRGNNLVTSIINCEVQMPDNTHENITSSFDLPPNLDIQKMGAAITYAKRYNIVALLNLNIEDDDDGNSATKKTETKPEPKKEIKPPVKITPACKSAMGLIENATDLGGLKVIFLQIQDSVKLTKDDKDFLNNLIKEKKEKLK